MNVEEAGLRRAAEAIRSVFDVAAGVASGATLSERKNIVTSSKEHVDDTSEAAVNAAAKNCELWARAAARVCAAATNEELVHAVARDVNLQSATSLVAAPQIVLHAFAAASAPSPHTHTTNAVFTPAVSRTRAAARDAREALETTTSALHTREGKRQQHTKMPGTYIHRHQILAHGVALLAPVLAVQRGKLESWLAQEGPRGAAGLAMWLLVMASSINPVHATEAAEEIGYEKNMSDTRNADAAKWKTWNQHTRTEVVNALRAVMAVATNSSKDETESRSSAPSKAASWLLALHPVLACTIADASIHLARAYVGVLVDADEAEMAPADGNDARNSDDDHDDDDARMPTNRRRRRRRHHCQTQRSSLDRIAKQVAMKRQRACARAMNIRNANDMPHATPAATPIAETLVSTSWKPIDHCVHAVCCEQNSRIGKYVRAALTPRERTCGAHRNLAGIWRRPSPS